MKYVKLFIFFTILLLSTSVVSAGFWDWVTGKVTGESSVIDVLNEGEAKTYTINGIDYEVAFDYLNPTSAKFSVNGESTSLISVDDSYKLADGVVISVNNITYQDFAEGIKKAEFTLSVGEEEVKCLDSDGGKNYEVKGTATGYLGISSQGYGPGELFDNFTDHCLSDSAMMENYCKENSEGDLWVYQSYYECPNGCKDGACSPVPAEEEAEEEIMCTDSDDGKNFYVKGITRIGDRPEFNEDYCYGNRLSEFYCNDLGGTSKFYYMCPYGCENGVCLKEYKEKIPCTDSDGGKNYYIRGFTKGHEKPNGIYDACAYTDEVYEHYCENNSVKLERYKCSSGECKDGACIIKESTGCSALSNMNSCLDDSNCYWDQQYNKCYKYDSTKQTCSDPDNGKNYYTQAHTFGFRTYSSAEDPSRDLRIRTGGKDACIGNKLREHYCYDNYYIYTIDTTCPNGCSNGTCVKTEEETQCKTLADEMRMYIDSSGKGYIGCDTTIYGDFSLAGSYCEGQKTGVKKYLIPDAYRRSDRYYATLTGLDPNEEVKVFVVTNSGKKIECSPTLNQQIPSTTKPKQLIDLSNYPNMFISNGRFNGVLVVGDRASAEHVISLSDIAVSLESGDNIAGSGVTRIDIGSARLASEVADPFKLNVISVGPPCANAVTSQLMGNPPDCAKGYTKGKGSIKLFNYNGFAQIVVAGYTDIDTRKTARVLANWNDYNLRGNEICVYGSSINPYIGDCGDILTPTTEETIPCTDSDGGVNYYAKGYVKLIGDPTFGINGRKNDVCWDDGIHLSEYVCENGVYKGDHNYLCSNGCRDGACISFVAEEEEILYEEEEIDSSIGCPSKTCNTLSERCSGKDKIKIEECKVYIQDDDQCEEIIITKSRIKKGECLGERSIFCQGCQLNQETCVPFWTRIEKEDTGYYCDTDQKMSQQKPNGENCQNSYECVTNNCKGSVCNPICNGCLNEDSVCIPFGTRTNTQYCDTDYTFKDFKSEERSCNNYYECASSVCVNNECISQNLIQKITSWFKGLFGG
tara:strand:+ start:48 stop:3140 length:3093 start_codon:yes stop_codon:yes gene_type:complete